MENGKVVNNGANLMKYLVKFCTENNIDTTTLNNYAINIVNGMGYATFINPETEEDTKVLCIEYIWIPYNETAEQFVKADKGGKIEFFRDFFGMFSKAIKENKQVSSETCFVYSRLVNVVDDGREYVVTELLKRNANLFEAILNGKTYDLSVITNILDCIL